MVKMGLITRILVECWSMTVEMAPYLLLGFAIAGMLSAFITPATVEKHLGGCGLWPVIKASLFGVPLPLCSCGVLPVTASLRKHGAGKGATLSFLISTPQTGVDSILVTYSLLGPVFAVFRPIAAFVSGILGGFTADRLDPDVAQDREHRAHCDDECCGTDARKRNRLVQSLRHGFVVLPRDIAVPMVGGLLIAGAVSAMIPEDFFAAHLGGGFVSMLVMMVVSIPVYVCATASVPIAAAMMMKGLSPGAALVFLIAGPATNAAALATLWKILGRRSVLIYLATVAVTSLVCGAIINALVGTSAPAAAAMNAHLHCAETTNLFGTASAIVLLILLGVAWVGGLRRNRD